MLEGSTPEITFMKDSLQHCWNEVVFWRQQCMDQGMKIEELEFCLAEATRWDTRDDFNRFIAHHWLPFQLMVFTWMEHPHCASSQVSFPPLSCSGPMFWDGGLTNLHELGQNTPPPSLESITTSFLSHPDHSYSSLVVIFSFEPTLSIFKGRDLVKVEEISSGGDEGGGGGEGESGELVGVGFEWTSGGHCQSHSTLWLPTCYEHLLALSNPCWTLPVGCSLVHRGRVESTINLYPAKG